MVRFWPKADEFGDAAGGQLLGYTGRAADVVGTAALDPEERFDHALSCNGESHDPLA
jgi:hypothetical protein